MKMKPFLIIFYVVLSSSSTVIAQSNLTSNFRGTNDSISDTCGGVLNKPKGGIVYKVLGPIQRNERCVWLIRAGQATSFSIDIHPLYTRSNSDAQILATCMRKNHYTYLNFRMNETGPVAGIGICNIVVITYSTATNVTSSSTGFVLQYSTVQGASQISTSSTDYFFNVNNPSVLRHPALPSQVYSANELSTFTFVSLDSEGAHKPSSTISVTYIKTQLEGSCFDFLYVFFFNATPRNWQPATRICDQEAFRLITSQEPMLLTFETSNAGQFAGFNLLHSATGGCEN